MSLKSTCHANIDGDNDDDNYDDDNDNKDGGFYVHRRTCSLVSHINPSCRFWNTEMLCVPFFVQSEMYHSCRSVASSTTSRRRATCDGA